MGAGDGKQLWKAENLWCLWGCFQQEVFVTHRLEGTKEEDGKGYSEKELRAIERGGWNKYSFLFISSLLMSPTCGILERESKGPW